MPSCCYFFRMVRYGIIGRQRCQTKMKDFCGNWGIWIRTRTSRTKICCATVTPSPKTIRLKSFEPYTLSHRPAHGQTGESGRRPRNPHHRIRGLPLLSRSSPHEKQKTPVNTGGSVVFAIHRTGYNPSSFKARSWRGVASLMTVNFGSSVFPFFFCSVLAGTGIF